MNSRKEVRFVRVKFLKKTTIGWSEEWRATLSQNKVSTKEQIRAKSDEKENPEIKSVNEKWTDEIVGHKPHNVYSLGQKPWVKRIQNKNLKIKMIDRLWRERRNVSNMNQNPNINVWSLELKD